MQLAKQEVDHKDEAEDKEESGDQGRGVGDGNVKKSNSGTEMMTRDVDISVSVCMEMNLLSHGAGGGRLSSRALSSHGSH